MTAAESDTQTAPKPNGAEAAASGDGGAKGAPLFYGPLSPLSASKHKTVGLTPDRLYPSAHSANAIPLTVEEFPRAQNAYPIVFTSGEASAPAALTSIAAGTNDFVDAQGRWRKGTYIPSYVRRLPFHLMRGGEEDATRRILCIDLASPLVDMDAPEDRRLFKGEEPSEIGKNALDFCIAYETAAARTEVFMRRIKELDLLEEAAIKISRGDADKQIKGFSMIPEKKLRELGDAELAELARSGALAMIHAHQFSIARFGEMTTGAEA